MPNYDTPRRVSVGALTGRQLAVLVEVLAPYRGEMITAPLIELASQLALITTPKHTEAAQ